MHPATEAQATTIETSLFSVWSNPKAPRTKRRATAFVSLALYGLRRSEITGLNRCDLDPAGHLYVSTTKGGHPRRLRIDPRLARVLIHVHATHSPGAQRLFAGRNGAPLQRHLMDEWSHRYLPPGLSLHSLRHTAAVRCWRATHDVLAVMHLLGHSSLRHTHAYLCTLTPTVAAGFPRWRPPASFPPQLYSP